MKNVIPQQEVPVLKVKTVNGMKWDLRDQQPENFTLVVFYRGLHCPVCKKYLEELIEGFRFILHKETRHLVIKII